jgi:type III secretion protein Q
MTVVLATSAELALRVPPDRRSGPGTRARWLDHTQLALPLIVGRCALHQDDLARLGVNDLITLEAAAGPGRLAAPGLSALASGTEYRPRAEVDAQGRRPIELGFAGGGVGVAAAAGAVEAEVVTGYVRRDMSLPDDAHVELTVGLGTTRLSLRQLAGLSLGQIIPLGRPLAGPFEVRAAGRVLGHGELVDVDGELAVRMVSLGD